MVLRYATRAEEEVDVWKAKSYAQTKNMTRTEKAAHYDTVNNYLKEQGLGHLLVKNTPVRSPIR
jgi:hypothetical protein